jgi:hypothetical protein
MDRTSPTTAIEARCSSPSLAEPAPGSDTPPSDFERASEPRRTGPVVELWGFLCENKAWCLAPIVAALSLLGLILLLSSSAAAPFIYTLF